MDKKKKPRHRRVLKWFYEGEMPPFINLCRYVRTVMLWAPLKAIFYSPWRALFRKSKILFSLVMLSLFGAVITVLAFTVPSALIWIGIISAYILLRVLIKVGGDVIEEKWRKADDTRFVQYSEKTGRVLRRTSWYVLGLPLETILWTVWVKIYDFSPVLLGIVLTIVVGGISWFLIFIGLWKALAIIGVILVVVLILIIHIEISDRVDLNESLIWQWLKAKKSKICPIIDLREEE